MIFSFLVMYVRDQGFNQIWVLSFEACKSCPTASISRSSSSYKIRYYYLELFYSSYCLFSLTAYYSSWCLGERCCRPKCSLYLFSSQPFLLGCYIQSDYQLHRYQRVLHIWRRHDHCRASACAVGARICNVTLSFFPPIVFRLTFFYPY